MVKKFGRPALLGLLAVILFGSMINGVGEKGVRSCMPAFAYLTERETGSELWQSVEHIFPVLSFHQGKRVEIHRQDKFLLKYMKPVELLTMMSVENFEEMTPEKENVTDVMPEPTKQEAEELPESPTVPSTTTAEPPIQTTSAMPFVPHTLQTIVDIKPLEELDALVGAFYTVDGVAKVDGNMLNAKTLNEKDLRITKATEGPQILIYHTHSQEAFADSIPGDTSTSIVGVGEHLAEILRSRYGYEVLHHTGAYDVQTRDNAYSRALPEVQKILEENPTIQVVIDLHRDGLAEGAAKLVMDLDGRPTARFMFFNGVSCGKKSGNIDYLHNPNLQENLAFSFQLKKAAEEYYPGLTRKNYINAYRYNMHICGRTTLIELGAQNNTVEEVMNACDPIAHILDMVLSGA